MRNEIENQIDYEQDFNDHKLELIAIKEILRLKRDSSYEINEDLAGTMSNWLEVAINGIEKSFYAILTIAQK